MKTDFFSSYSEKLQVLLKEYNWSNLYKLAESLLSAWKEQKQVFMCGNGGSAANAIHLANDLIYGVSKEDGIGMKIHSLAANSSILTCLANDISYEDIYSQQIAVLGNPGDILVVFSGSGNSPNIVKAIQRAKEMGLLTFAVLGYSGGKCLEIADTSIHFPINDMQISEDCQLIVGHMLMRWLSNARAC